jgi:hypothetical protein
MSLGFNAPFRRERSVINTLIILFLADMVVMGISSFMPQFSVGGYPDGTDRARVIIPGIICAISSFAVFSRVKVYAVGAPFTYLAHLALYVLNRQGWSGRPNIHVEAGFWLGLITSGCGIILIIAMALIAGDEEEEPTGPAPPAEKDPVFADNELLAPIEQDFAEQLYGMGVTDENAQLRFRDQVRHFVKVRVKAETENVNNGMMEDADFDSLVAEEFRRQVQEFLEWYPSRPRFTDVPPEVMEKLGKLQHRKLERFLKLLGPKDHIVLYDGEVKLMDCERWERVLEQGTEDKFQVLF